MTIIEEKTLRVLVADDDPDILALLTMNLEGQGYLVESVTDGEEARDAALRMLPDLIVLDVMMPKMDGLEVLTILKNHEATKNIPVVMLTAKASDTDVWGGWQSGADYYITKPFDLDELLHFIGYLRVNGALID